MSSPVSAPGGLHVVDDATVSRTELVRPAMCGHNSLLAGRIGDWTWDAVSALCGADVLCARNLAGLPTYLSFYFYRIKASSRFHLRTPTFGDRLHATSRLFDFGSESVLALHRIARSPAGEPDRTAGPAFVDADEFYAFADEDCLYVENFNRWIARSDERSNRDLVRSSPVGFRHRHLPALDEAHSPRARCHQARTSLSFLDRTSGGGYIQVAPPVEATYHIDLTRDLNGVGLVYFATYFSIVDWALLQLWRAAGRSGRSFLERIVTDQQLCCVGNTDADGVITATATLLRIAGDDEREFVDVVLRDRAGDRLLAVCTLELLTARVG